MLLIHRQIRSSLCFALLSLSLTTGCGDSDIGGADNGGNGSGASSNGGLGNSGSGNSGSGNSGSDNGSSGNSGADNGSSGNGGASGEDSGNGGFGGANDASDGGELTLADGEVGTATSVFLGEAGNYVILAKSGISSVPPSVITGDLGVSPVAASAITGFSLSLDATETFATSSQVTGAVYAADYDAPTPSNMTTAITDMELALTDAAGRAPDVTELGAGNIGGMTLVPGVYKWASGLLIPTDVTLAGGATDVWIFQIAQNLTLSSGVHVVLTEGALPENVFWQVSGRVTLGTTAHLEGVVLSQTSVTLRTGASLNGRVLAQTAVALDSNTLVAPAQ